MDTTTTNNTTTNNNNNNNNTTTKTTEDVEGVVDDDDDNIPKQVVPMECFLCRVATENPPCDSCKTVRFCSEHHRLLYWNRFHRTKCRDGGIISKGCVGGPWEYLNTCPDDYYDSHGCCLDCVDEDWCNQTRYSCISCSKNYICQDHEQTKGSCKICRRDGKAITSGGMPNQDGDMQYYI